MIKLNELNTLPVPTFRWLRVNELAIDDEIDFEARPYGKDFLQMAPQGELIQRQMPYNGLTDRPIMKDLMDSAGFGVSEDLVGFADTFHNSGMYIEIPRGIKVTEPIMVGYKPDSDNPTVIDNNLIIAHEHSEVTIVMDIASSANASAVHNGVTRVVAKEGAMVTVIKIQRMNDSSFHFDSNLALVGSGARVDYIVAELGSKKAAVNYTCRLSEGAQSHINTVYLGNGDRHLDLSFLMEHQGRRSTSSIEARGALRDMASKTFKGTIDFKKGADKSEGSESEHVLLFDRTVKSISVPLLLCSEDDVKGQHAISSGKVDQDKLFYLMSRGFSRGEAMVLLAEASFSDVIDKIYPKSLEDLIRAEISGRLLHGN